MLGYKQIAGSNIHYYRYSLDYFINSQVKLGIDRIELWCSTPHLFIDHMLHEDADLISQKFFQNDIHIVAVTPKPYNYSVCSPYDTLHRKYSLAYHLNCIDLTAKLEVPIMCISSTGGCLDNSYEAAWNCCLDALTSLSDAAIKKGVTLALGTVCAGESKILTTVDELKEMVQQIKKTADIKVFLDTQVICEAGETITQWFNYFGKDIVHINFVDGRSDGCHVWGDGCYPLGRFLQELETCGYTGYLAQHLAGEQYHIAPFDADRRNLSEIGKYIIRGVD